DRFLEAGDLSHHSKDATIALARRGKFEPPPLLPIARIGTLELHPQPLCGRQRLSDAGRTQREGQRLDTITLPEGGGWAYAGLNQPSRGNVMLFKQGGSHEPARNQGSRAVRRLWQA